MLMAAPWAATLPSKAGRLHAKATLALRLAADADER
jgi:hypothetical protein